MDLELLSVQMIILLILMAVGYICGKTGLITSDSQIKLSNLILRVGIPSMIIVSVSEDFKLTVSDILCYLIGFFLFNISLGIVSLLIVKITRIKNDFEIYQFMYMFSNVGFMGLPVIQATLGEKSTLLAALFLLPSNLVLFTYGEYLMAEKQTFSLKKFLTPPVLASFIAILICIFKLKLPFVLMQSLSYLGNITTPLAMLIIGSSFSSMSSFKVSSVLQMIRFIIIKLLVLPVLYWYILGFLNISRDLQILLVLLTAMPVASNVVIYANIYRKNVGLATQASVLTSIICVITIPIVFAVINIL